MKRHLTKLEICDILSGIRIYGKLPEAIKHSTKFNITYQLKKQLEAVEIYPELIPKLKQKILEKYHSSLVQPGGGCRYYYGAKYWRTANADDTEFVS